MITNLEQKVLKILKNDNLRPADIVRKLKKKGSYSYVIVKNLYLKGLIEPTLTEDKTMIGKGTYYKITNKGKEELK